MSSEACQEQREPENLQVKPMFSLRQACLRGLGASNERPNPYSTGMPHPRILCPRPGPAAPNRLACAGGWPIATGKGSDRSMGASSARRLVDSLVGTNSFVSDVPAIAGADLQARVGVGGEATYGWEPHGPQFRYESPMRGSRRAWWPWQVCSSATPRHPSGRYAGPQEQVRNVGPHTLLSPGKRQAAPAADPFRGLDPLPPQVAILFCLG